MNLGLRMSATNGPRTPPRGPEVISSTSLRCAAVSFARAMRGMRSGRTVYVDFLFAVDFLGARADVFFLVLKIVFLFAYSC